MIDKILAWFPEDMIYRLDGFDDAIIGIDDASIRLIYSVDKCINILISRGMEEEDAIDYFHDNIKSAWIGEQTPIFCTDDL